VSRPDYAAALAEGLENARVLATERRALTEELARVADVIRGAGGVVSVRNRSDAIVLHADRWEVDVTSLEPSLVLWPVVVRFARNRVVARNGAELSDALCAVLRSPTTVLLTLRPPGVSA